MMPVHLSNKALPLCKSVFSLTNIVNKLGITSLASKTTFHQRKSHCRRSLAAKVSGGLVLTSFIILPLVDSPLTQHTRLQHTPIVPTDSSTHNTEGNNTEPPTTKMEKPSVSAALKKAKAETMWGLFVADSLAMPVHWYYNTDDIQSDFGKWLTGYEAPKDRHPSSILRLSAVDGSGRGATNSKNSLIGNVILHGKLKYWNGSGAANHYHQGMQAGDNTLNAVMALKELQSMNKFDRDLVKSEREVRSVVLEDYVNFMTTPGTHSDTYAESFHRSFFKDWLQGGQPKSADDLLTFTENRHHTLLQQPTDSQLVAIGSFVPAIPWIVRNAHKSEDECAMNVADFIKLTHPAPALVPFIDVYARLLHAVINGKDLKSEILRVLSNAILGGPAKRDMILNVLDRAANIPRGSTGRLEFHQAMISNLGSACYVEGAFSSLLFLALEFHDDFEGGVLANANCGGENCHRGAALGALLAAAAANRGQEVPSKFKDNLHALRGDLVSALEAMNDGF